MPEHHDTMTEIQIEGYKALLERRGLENSFQVLKAFLVKGSSILDVGCGPGTVTIDVARYVDSGSVVGVDLMPEMVERSQEYAASKKVENVTFQVGNSYELDFADNRFDLTYSLNMMVHLTDPVRALAEQARVTKPGGYVLANIGDYGAKIFYPACPAFERVIAATASLNDPADPSLHIDFFLGRRAHALFVEGGFDEVRVLPEAAPLSCIYHGASNFEEEHEFNLRFTDMQDPLIGDLVSKLWRLGLVDESLLAAARAELERWYADPSALMLDQVAFWGIGRVR